MAGAPNSAGMCQPNIRALFGAPALLDTGFLIESTKVAVVLSDFTGTIESRGTILLALLGILTRF